MTRWLLAAQSARNAGTQPTKPTKPGRGEVPSVLSVVSGAGRATPPAQSAAPSPSRQERPSAPNAGAFRHGRSGAGDPLTWTGRIVSLDAWRALSEWERRGPGVRLWCGCCSAWVDRETALAHAEARRAEWLVAKGKAYETAPTN